MTISAIRAKRPNNPAWRQVEVEVSSEYPAIAFIHDRMGLFVISAVEVAETAIGPEYHLSITKSGRRGPRRCSKSEAEMVIRQFDAEGALEDNHGSIARNYWMPVNESLIGQECDCKGDEAVIREGDFEWRPLTQSNADRAKLLRGGDD